MKERLRYRSKNPNQRQRKFLDPANLDYPGLDLGYGTAVNRFNFAMPVKRQNSKFGMNVVSQ